jgi:hypothetical protein
MNWEQQFPVLAAFVALFGILVVPLIRYIDKLWKARVEDRDKAAAKEQAETTRQADLRVAREQATNAEVSRLWQERVNREVAATAEADRRTAEANARCTEQAVIYERKLAEAGERQDQLIGLGNAAVQTTHAVARKRP